MPSPTPANALPQRLADIRACRLCEAHLPHGVRPVVQADARAGILIVGQAPGRAVHLAGIPFNDPSGDRLRQWMGIDREVFYDATRIAIVPMGFCFPGSTAAGDLPPRPECAPAWRKALLALLPNIRLTLVIGQYAQAWHLPQARAVNVTATVAAWRQRWPQVVPLPHPSPRNQLWLKRNPWFATEVVPALQGQIAQILTESR